MDIILRKFKVGKIRFAFDNTEELRDLLMYLSGIGFNLVANIDAYIDTAMDLDSKTLLCEYDNLYTSSIIKEDIIYISYKELFGPKYNPPSKDSLMEFLGE